MKKFSENETFSCLLQPASEDILKNKESGVWTLLNLRDHAVKGHWSEQMFHGRNCPIVLELGCGKGEYTTALAERNPEMNYIGVDIKGARLWRELNTLLKQVCRMSLSSAPVSSLSRRSLPPEKSPKFG